MSTPAHIPVGFKDLVFIQVTSFKARLEAFCSLPIPFSSFLRRQEPRERNCRTARRSVALDTHPGNCCCSALPLPIYGLVRGNGRLPGFVTNHP